MATKKKNVYRVVFNNQGKAYEIYAKNVTQGGMFGFVEVEGLLFGEKTTVVVDPAEEALQREFAGVERIHIPLHSVLRIDEVEKRGTSRIRPIAEGVGKVTMLPTPIAPRLKSDS